MEKENEERDLEQFKAHMAQFDHWVDEHQVHEAVIGSQLEKAFKSAQRKKIRELLVFVLLTSLLLSIWVIVLTYIIWIFIVLQILIIACVPVISKRIMKVA